MHWAFWRPYHKGALHFCSKRRPRPRWKRVSQNTAGKWASAGVFLLWVPQGVHVPSERPRLRAWTLYGSVLEEF